MFYVYPEKDFFCDEEEASSKGLEIEGNYGGLRSTVISTEKIQNGFKFVLVESLDTNPNNQIQEYLYYNGGEGVQHITLSTFDMVDSLIALKNRGAQFIQVPPNYYSNLFNNEGSFLKDKWNDFQSLSILMDVSKQKHEQEQKYLLQTFTIPINDRPTFFLEIIRRNGSSGFGKNSIKALFIAIEQLQQQRIKNFEK